MSHQEHQDKAPARLNFAVLTVSDSRDKSTDGSGRTILAMLAERGHGLVEYRIVPDEPELIRQAVGEWLARDDLQAVVVNGGTGVSPRDRTVEAVEPLLDMQLPGFGEIFRWLSYQEIGPAAMLSRALAGTASGRILFCLPGSTGACRLAMERLILPQAGHLWAMLHPERSPGKT